MRKAAPSTPAKRWYLRLSLRALLGVVLILSILFAWFANWRTARLREHAMARKLESHGGTVMYCRSPLAMKLFGADFQKTKRSPVAALPAEYFVVVDAYRTAEIDSTQRKFHYAPINNELVDLLVQLPHLQYLTLESRLPHDADLGRLQDLPQLTWLALDCQTTDDDVAHFRDQRQLKTLRLTGQGITRHSFSLLEQNPQLEEFYLEAASITDADLLPITRHPAIKKLSLRGSPITSAGIAQLISMKQLEALHLAGTLVDDQALPSLLQMDNLRLIEVRGTAISVEGQQQLKDASGFRTVQ